MVSFFALLAALTAIIALILLSWLILAITHRVLCSFPSTLNLLGPNLLSKALGLGVSAFLFPSAFEQIGHLAINAFLGLWNAVTPAVENLIGNGNSYLIGLGRPQTVGTGAFSDELRLISVVEVTKAVVCAAAFGHLAGALLSTNAASSQPRIFVWWQHRTIPARQNLLLGIVLISGVFLSFASIIAVPWLRDDPESRSISAKEVENSAREIGLSDKQIANDLPEEVPALPQFNRLLARLSAQTADDRLKPIAADAQRLDARRKAQETTWADTRAELLSVNAQLQQDVLAALRGALADKVTPQELRKYSRELDEWAQFSIDIYRRKGIYFRTEWRSESDAIERWATEALVALNSGSEPKEPAPRTDITVQFSFGQTPFESYIMPQPGPAIVSGPFGYIANWLIETRSLALATICGMLGFGILGAAISSFIRSDGKETPGNGGRVHDLAGLIVRGFSAAIVIFLSVEGGIAIFSTDQSDPNPYVLFFTCMIGAVYSEPVWEWARLRLQNSLPALNKPPLEQESNAESAPAISSAPGHKPADGKAPPTSSLVGQAPVEHSKPADASLPEQPAAAQ